LKNAYWRAFSGNNGLKCPWILGFQSAVLSICIPSYLLKEQYVAVLTSMHDLLCCFIFIRLFHDH
jgi:hypothetical protein